MPGSVRVSHVLLSPDSPTQDFRRSKIVEIANLNIQTSRRASVSFDEAKVVDSIDQSISYGPEDFELLDLVGEGAYGRVLKVEEKSSKKIFAMKIIPKKLVMKKNDSDYVKEERNILSKVEHPFIVSLQFAFQTDTKLYLVMDFASGGELFHFLESEGLFLEPTAMFYLAQMVLAVDYLHSCNVVHRDLKPENVLLDGAGDIKLTDFGLAKENISNDDRTKTICGTDLYMAPEMIKGSGYGKSVDWWSLGALTYEMLTGDPPFYAKDTKKLYGMIVKNDAKFPKFLSGVSVSLMKGMLCRNSTKRLGCTESTMFKIGGVAELKNHPFFDDIEFNEIFDRKVKAPFYNKSPEIKTSAEKEAKLLKKKKNLVAEEQQIARKTPEHNNNSEFTGFSFVNKSFLQAVIGDSKPNNVVTQGETELVSPVSSEEPKATGKECDFEFECAYQSTEDQILARLDSFRISRVD